MKRRLLSVFAAGLLSAAGFEPLNLWPVALAALAVMIHALAQAETRKAALLTGYVFGLGHFIAGNSWIAGAFRYQEEMPVWLGWIAVVALAFYIAIYPALATGLAWKLSGERRKGAGFVLLLAAAWIITEWLRARVFTGYAWNPLAVIAVEAAPATRWVGSYGLSGLILLVAGGLWLAAHRQWKRALPLILVPLALTGAGYAAQINADMKRLNVSERKAYTSGILARIVQPNIAQQDKYRPDYERENFLKLATLSGNAGPQPRLLLWPEAAVPDFIGEPDEEAARARRRIATLLGPDDIVLTGADTLFSESKQVGPVIEKRWIGAANSVFALDAKGAILGRYDKAHLVPYGEYLPMRPFLSLIGLSRLVPGDLDFWPGPGPRTLDLGKDRHGRSRPRVGLQICYEIIFSGEVVDPDQRPDFIFNPSNDAWFGSWGPPQHLAQARLRAIEEGLPVIRSTPTGISAIIDADGRVLKRLPYRQPGYLESMVPAAMAPTLFSRFGNFLSLGLAFFLGLAGIALNRRLR
ncbi:MAG: apolipoprotein N-acyltransferase [Sphingomonadales bacterium]|nr:apolipoprotein N-acyltransferase [Sphingomonadales bacterium]